MKEIQFRTGSVDPHFAENGRIAVANFLAGRPFDEGMLPPTHIPDPNGLPEWITIQVPDDHG